MEPGDANVQGTVHSMDQGKLAFLIRWGGVVLVVLCLAIIYLGYVPSMAQLVRGFAQFRGLSNSSAMDQAQIARNIANGHGFTTLYIRPMALDLIEQRSHQDGAVDVSNFPDFYQSPLSPWVNSLALRLLKPSEKMLTGEFIYPGDRLIATMATLCFLLSVVVWYFVIKHLFDQRLARLSCALVLLTDMMWRFSLTGLPQMLVLLLFGVACLLTLYAMEAAEYDHLPSTIGWIIGAGVAMGLMTLAHGLCVWIFIGWMGFLLIRFVPRALIGPAALAAYLLVVTPWMARNYEICGNPLGMAVYDAVYEGKPEEGYLRFLKRTDDAEKMSIKAKFHLSFFRQIDGIFGLLGMNVAAIAFFFALFHPFRNSRTMMFKWGAFLMWFFAFLGMAFYGGFEQFSENQMMVVFVPLFVAYGMAFLLVLWNRAAPDVPIFRNIFIGFISLFCALPMISNIVSGPTSMVQWPPYIPPLISVLGDWFKSDEVICSDMPWAVAWYAQRISLLLPDSPRTLSKIHDYQDTKQSICGLYLTPVTGDQKFDSSLFQGNYKDWAPLVMRPPKLDDLPFPAYVALPINAECMLFADHIRWNQTSDSQP